MKYALVFAASGVLALGGCSGRAQPSAPAASGEEPEPSTPERQASDSAMALATDAADEPGTRALDAGSLDAAPERPGTLDGAADGGPAATLVPHAPLPEARALSRDLFATGLVCSECHSASDRSGANRDEQNRPVGLYELWSASAMANAARDPLFRAALANEIARAPEASERISSVCLSCHSPMARVTQKRADAGPTLLSDLYAPSDQGALARDGVSCTLCHQVQPANLGQEASYSAGYVIGTTREIYGPYAAPFSMPMRNRTGFTPAQGLHMQESAMCGTCHALVTESLTPGGAPTGHRMGEQLTYLEWRHSAYSTEGGGTTPTSCQSCHMPDLREDGLPLSTRLAHRPDGNDFPPLAARGPFSRHSFVGANTVLPKLLRSGRALLHPAASDIALSDAEHRARDLLRERTAAVSVADLQHTGDSLMFRVRVENRAGHKLPSGYPSRRLFLHVRVLGADGAPLFELGGVDGSGRIVGESAQPLAAEHRGGPTYPHRVRVATADEPVVWESVMSDGHGGPSYELLAAEGFLKDNRLLPIGHSDATTGPLSTAPVGVTDSDFRPGSDEVRFELSALHGKPTRIEIRLLYQTFSPRYLDELLARTTPEMHALRGMLDASTLAPELVAQTIATVP